VTRPPDTCPRIKNILIGSANINCFYNLAKFENYTPYVMVNCIQFEDFKARKECLEEEEKEDVVSVIKNFLCAVVSFKPEV
jgi:hypothetical protein